MSLTQQTVQAYKERRLLSSIARRILSKPSTKSLRDYFDYRFNTASEDTWNLENLNNGLRDHNTIPSIPTSELDRIINSYELMKRHQKGSNPELLPSKHWQDNLSRSFADIESALKKGQTDELALLLQNFLRNRSLGISVEAGMRFRSNSERLAYINAIHNQFAFWRYCYPNEDVRSIAMPLIGNPRGYFYNGHLINTASFFNQSVAEELSNLIVRLNYTAPTIAEIGGGYGPMGHALLRRQQNSTYLDFDLPEIIVIAFYFLSTAFPDSKILLYGEQRFDRSSFDDYDIILLPNYAIDDLPDNSCHLFVNQTSFGEMNSGTVTYYLSQIARCCRGAFFHMNHEFRSDTHSQDPGAKAGEYPVSKEDFRLIYRNPHMPHYFFYKDMYQTTEDIFSYLYLKKV